jgi:hypothetical protein
MFLRRMGSIILKLMALGAILLVVSSISAYFGYKHGYHRAYMDLSAKKYASGVVLDTAKNKPVTGAILKIVIDGPVPTSSGNN